MLEATVLDLQNATRVALENGNWKKIYSTVLMWQRFWTMGSLDFCCSHLKKIHTIEIEKKQLWTLALSNFWAWKFKFQNSIFHAKKVQRCCFFFSYFWLENSDSYLIFHWLNFSAKNWIIFLEFWRENSNSLRLQKPFRYTICYLCKNAIY